MTTEGDTTFRASRHNRLLSADLPADWTEQEQLLSLDRSTAARIIHG